MFFVHVVLCSGTCTKWWRTCTGCHLCFVLSESIIRFGMVYIWNH